MIQLFFDGIIESAEKKCTVEMAHQIRNLTKNYMQIIKLHLTRLIRAFDEKVDKFLTIPMEMTPHRLGAEHVDAVYDVNAANAEENALKEHIDELETVYKQQAILLGKLRAELEFYDTVMDVQAEIDDGLCILVENYMQMNDNELNGDERILEYLNKVSEAKNTKIEA